MPTIKYCDFAAGNDSTGDGTAGNPYKTINKASTGLTGGDEVRCAKSAAPSAMSGTMTFTDGSTSVATSEDLTGSLAAQDFVGLNTAGETWWEISSITSTTITLVVKYCGDGGTGTGYKLGVIDTGSAASATTDVQTVASSGSSEYSKLKISGGWNLAGTPAQDGYTWFFQSGATKNGRGLRLSNKDYCDIDGRLGFLRYNRGVEIGSSSDFNRVNSVQSLGCYLNGIRIDASYGNVISSVVCHGCGVGIYCYYCHENVIQYAILYSNDYGIYLYYSTAIIKSAEYNYNGYGLYLYTASRCVSHGSSYLNSTWGNIALYDYNASQIRAASIAESESGGAARNKMVFYGGSIQDNTDEADSGKCIKFSPLSALQFVVQEFQVPVTASAARTVSVKMKDDADFNGSVYLELWYLGECITGPTEKTMTTSYAAQEMTAASGDISVDGVLILKVKVYGTAGAVYADTVSYT